MCAKYGIFTKILIFDEKYYFLNLCTFIHKFVKKN